jgi:hypothetical protein
MGTDTKLAAFFWGGFGGILPTIAEKASTYVSIPNTPLPEWGLLLGVLLWAVVGGGVALMNTSYEAKQALFAGVAAPAILASVISGASGASQKISSVPPLFGISVYAQPVDRPAASGTDGWAVIVSPNVSGGVPQSVSLPVTAEVKKGDQTETVTIGQISDLRSPTAFTVPTGTSQIFVSGKPVSTTGTVTNVDLSVKTAPSNGGDLLWALGVPRRFEIQQLDVAPRNP